MRNQGISIRVLLCIGLLLTLLSEKGDAEPFAYVSNEYDDTVTVVDTATDKVVATIEVGDRPRGIGLSPEGKKLYLALGNDNVIGIVDTDSRKMVGTFST